MSNKIDPKTSRGDSSWGSFASEKAKSVERSVARYRFNDEDGEHLHTLDGKPLIGTSTAVRVLNKPLTWWAAGMALAPLGWLNKNKAKVGERKQAACGMLLKLQEMEVEDYEKLLQDCYRAHDTRKKTAAVTGTDMHASLERYVKACIYNNAGQPPFLPEGTYESSAVEIFSRWAYDNVAEFLWSEGHCYSERLWTGGICDAGTILKDGRLAVIDFKSSREAYFDQFIQAGGYALQIQENALCTAAGTPISMLGLRLAIGALIVFPFGGTGEPAIQTNVAGYTAAFESCVTLHKLQQRFEK